jgi:dual specificity protein kinase YAK1
VSSPPTTSQPQSQFPEDMNYNDRDGDIKMEDADPYKPKHASLHMSHASHQRLPSNVQQEESVAARRYSPMNLSPSSPFTAAAQPASQSPYTSYTPQSSTRASPTRTSYVAPPNSYYASPPSSYFETASIAKANHNSASRPSAPQLPPIQPSMGQAYHPQSAPLTLSPYTRDLSAVSSPRQAPVLSTPIPKGPVPKFTKCTNIAELQPTINSQPPFRRAKPEGGFLSVRSFAVNQGYILI